MVIIQNLQGHDKNRAGSPLFGSSNLFGQGIAQNEIS